MSRNRDIATILGRTENNNDQNNSILFDGTNLGLDSNQVTIISTDAGIAVYSELDSLPTSNLTLGDRAFVEGNKRLYISNGSGWYNVALINITPTMSLSPSGTIELATDGTTTSTVTIVATDSDTALDQLTYSVESDGNMLGRAVISQDSSVFTIRPLSSDSGATTGTFTLTFKTSDGINTASDSADFSLTFLTGVSGSASTISLLKAHGNTITNSDISYYNSSNVQTGFTETGDPTASTFSPYRSGGYSAYFDGPGSTDGLSVTGSTDFNLSSGDWTMEAWVYPDTQSDDYPVVFAVTPSSGGTNGIWLQYSRTGLANKFTVSYNNGTLLSSTNTFAINRWYHVAVVKNSGTITLYVDGSSEASASDTSTTYGNDPIYVGKWSTNIDTEFKGYVSDFRVVKGTAVYTAAFTPPTERLTAITGTQFLMGGLPYFADQSTNGHTITIIGDVSLKPFGPYDYFPWSVDDNVGSVHFDGNDYMLGADDVELGSSDFTVECWYYKTANSDDGILIGKRGNTWISGDWLVQAASTNQIKFWSYDYNNPGTSPLMTASAPPGINKWVHVAVTRSGNSWTIWVDGKSADTATWAGTIGNHSNPVILGADLYTGARLHHSGYIADVRVSVGTGQALYTADFTPPTEPLTRTSPYTKLLMSNLQSLNTVPNAGVYDAASAGRITLTGNWASRSTYKKFNTSSSFGGTGGATLNDLTPEYLGGDFTIQFWLYPVAWYNNGHIFGHWVGGEYHHFLIYSHSGTEWKFYASSNGTTWNLASVGATSIDRWTNSWKHVAMTYDESASTVKFWLNGTLESTFTGITGLTNNTYTSSVLSFSEDQNGAYNAYAGYLQDVKVSRSVEYTANFTPPTAEFEL